MRLPTLSALLFSLASCSSTSGPAATPDSASVNAAGAYIVVDGGTSYTLQQSGGVSSNGVNADFLRVGSTGAATAIGFSNGVVTLAGGAANGSYFTGVSGTPTAGLGVVGTLSLSGLYGVNNNGAISWGALNLTANLASATLVGSTSALSVGGTINGARVSGSVVHRGTSGSFEGGFYGPAASPTLGATFSGADMAGIFVVN